MLCEDWLEEGAEDELSTTGLWESKPEGEDKLEGVVEWEPVDGADQALKDGQETEDNPVSQPLSVVNLAGAEERIERVVSWNDEASEVGEDLAAEVEEDQEEVESKDAENSVDLWDGGLLLEVVEDWVLGQLLINLREVVLGTVLERHFEKSCDDTLAVKSCDVCLFAL